MTRYLYRDAITGRIVTKAYAQMNPATTVREKLGIVQRVMRAARRRSGVAPGR